MLGSSGLWALSSCGRSARAAHNCNRFVSLGLSVPLVCGLHPSAAEEGGACAGVRGGARAGVWQEWNGDRAGQAGVVRIWEAWKRLHWLSKMDAFSFHSAQVVGMGCS